MDSTLSTAGAIVNTCYWPGNENTGQKWPCWKGLRRHLSALREDRRSRKETSVTNSHEMGQEKRVDSVRLWMEPVVCRKIANKCVVRGRRGAKAIGKKIIHAKGQESIPTGWAFRPWDASGTGYACIRHAPDVFEKSTNVYAGTGFFYFTTTSTGREHRDTCSTL